MRLASILARPMLASYFIADGIDAVRSPEAHAAKFQKLTSTLERAGVPPVLTSDTVMLARVSGAVSAMAGFALAVGRKPRIAACTLALLNVPITLINNPVWDAPESEETRKEQFRGLFRGLGLGGGLILAAADSNGRPSLSWRMQNSREHRMDLREQRDQLRARYSDG